MRSVFLIGFMASGKSEVSRVLAKRLNMPCVDLDSVIEEQAGKTIACLFEEDGEQGFRLRERCEHFAMAKRASSPQVAERRVSQSYCK